MYAGRVACCPLVSRSEYVDGTDAMQAASLHFPLNAASKTSYSVFPTYLQLVVRFQRWIIVVQAAKEQLTSQKTIYAGRRRLGG